MQPSWLAVLQFQLCKALIEFAIFSSPAFPVLKFEYVVLGVMDYVFGKHGRSRERQGAG